MGKGMRGRWPREGTRGLRPRAAKVALATEGTGN
jgi:hypothetical protein